MSDGYATMSRSRSSVAVSVVSRRCWCRSERRWKVEGVRECVCDELVALKRRELSSLDHRSLAKSCHTPDTLTGGIGNRPRKSTEVTHGKRRMACFRGSITLGV